MAGRGGLGRVRSLTRSALRPGPEEALQRGFTEGDGLKQDLLLAGGQGADAGTGRVDHRAERPCPLGAGVPDMRVVQYLTRGVGVEMGRVGEGFAEGPQLAPAAAEFQGARPARV